MWNKLNLKILFFLIFTFNFSSFSQNIGVEDAKTTTTMIKAEVAVEPVSDKGVISTDTSAITPKDQLPETVKVPDIATAGEKPDDIASTDDNEVVQGLDTVSVREPEGNWLLKRIWWEKAQKKYEKIKKMVLEVSESRMLFFKKRNDLDRNLFDPFYREIDLGQGQLQEIIADLLDRLKEERQEEVTLGPEEKAFLTLLKEEGNKLKNLDADVNGIRRIDVAIDDDLTELNEQINRNLRYEDNAWHLFNAISSELSHKKARELYYKMDALWKNVKNIGNYLRGKFLMHFDSLIEDAKSHVARVKSVVEEFKEKGIDLKKQFKKLDEDEELDQELDEEKQSEEDDDEYYEEVGWLNYIWSGITWPFRMIWGWISSLWR